MSESEESGDEYQRDADAHMADSLNNIRPVKQQDAPDPPFSSPVNHPGEDPGFHTVGRGGLTGESGDILKNVCM